MFYFFILIFVIILFKMNSSNLKICRTCLNSVRQNDCIHISTEEENVAPILEMLSFIIPEMNLYLVTNTVICKRCLKLLKICFDFKTECMKNEEHLLKHSQNNNTKIDIEDVQLPEYRKQVFEDMEMNFTGSEFPAIQTFPSKNSETVLSCEKCYGCKLHSLDPLKHNKVSPPPPIVCHVCNKKLNTLYEMRKHVMSHTKLRKCKICAKRFRDLSQLKIHLRVHTQVKPFECDLCKKAFRQKHGLTQHMHQHSGSVSVMCKHCNKAFSTKYNAKVHMQTCGKVLEKCDLCGETFLSKKDLINHLETSTDTCNGDIKSKVKEEIDSVYIEENFSFIKEEPVVTEYKQEVYENDSFVNIKQEAL